MYEESYYLLPDLIKRHYFKVLLNDSKLLEKAELIKKVQLTRLFNYNKKMHLFILHSQSGHSFRNNTVLSELSNLLKASGYGNIPKEHANDPSSSASHLLLAAGFILSLPLSLSLTHSLTRAPSNKM